ncbi:MAG: FHA domain-containing protein [Planctomycetes bacterium]|nr:FHA domain-containing protein [Planctomycetota bacterium]
MGPHDPWTWLLGRTPEGAWRHVPYQAFDPGPGQDPALEPRVEVVRRLIAYPPVAFQTVIHEVAGLDGPARRARWLCFRAPGDDPARPYWLCVVSAEPLGRRFHMGLELFDRERLGLWFFSGFDPGSVPPELLHPFPSRADLRLPRLELTDGGLGALPLATWLREAWEDRLRFSRLAPATPAHSASAGSADASHVIQAHLLADSSDAGGGDAVAPRAARARLIACTLRETGGTGAASEGGEGAARPGEVSLHPLGRLVTVIGRDPRCDVVVVDRSVSAEHARIAWRDGAPEVEDLGSKNGTFIDGERLAPNAPRKLPPEARLELGAVPCLFVRDVDPPDPQRHQTKLKALVAGGRLPVAQADAARAEAARRGITPGEALLLGKAVALDDWAPRRGGGCAVLLAGLLTLLLAGCHSFALPPLYEQDLEPAPMRAGERRVEWDFDVGLRPLVQARGTADGERVEGHALFPLGLYERTPTSRRVRLYPVYQRTQRIDPDGFPDDDTIVFPFMFTGTHPVEGSYLYLFPFGGTLKGLLGKDEVVGVLFPLYAWTRDRDMETHHVLWPLISWTSGGGASGFRVLPFYGRQQKRDEDGNLVYDRTSVLWPLLHWANDGTNSRNRFESLVLFPLFGRTRSGWRDDDVVLWPFFRWWHDKKTGYREWRLPFPFFVRGSGPEHERLDLWPFFGYRQRGGYTRHFLLWPLGRREVQETEEYVDRRLWALPLFWRMHRQYTDGRGEDVRTSVWPLLRWTSKHDGGFEVRFPAPLWFEDPLLNFNTILEPLWRVFRWGKDGEGRAWLDLLLGAFSLREGPEGTRWDILGGLFGRTTRPDGTSRTRLLWAIEW